MIKLTIPGIPQPKQSSRFRIAKMNNGRSIPVSYQTKEVKDNERSIKMIINEQLPQDFKPFTKGVIVKKLHYVFPPLKTASKQQLFLIDCGQIIYKTTKPDLTDNLQKGLFDAMEGIVFMNDSQVCSIYDLKKYYGYNPRIEIELEELS
jgi:Holliday junction resolvase RusA-like endonuclease